MNLSRRMTNVQLTLDFTRYFVVRNCWSECFHVCDEHHVTLLPDEQPIFDTIEEARAWAAARGRNAEICPQTFGRSNFMVLRPLTLQERESMGVRP